MPQDAGRRRTAPPYARRWRQFSLRTMLGLTAFLAMGLGLLSHRARCQREAVNTITALQGEVIYAHQCLGHNFITTEAVPPGPPWLRQWLGGEYFDRIDTIRFLHSTLSAGDWEHLAPLLTRLPPYRGLCLAGSAVDDAALAQLARLNNFTGLDLTGTRISDAGLEHLRHSPRLEELHLMHTAVTDAGLRHLQGLPNLRKLNVLETAVSSQGAEEFRRARPGCTLWVASQ